jgi:hypothetical protein
MQALAEQAGASRQVSTNQLIVALITLVNTR